MFLKIIAQHEVLRICLKIVSTILTIPKVKQKLARFLQTKNIKEGSGMYQFHCSGAELSKERLPEHLKHPLHDLMMMLTCLSFWDLICVYPL